MSMASKGSPFTEHLRRWPLFLVCTVLALGCGYYYIVRTPSIYSISSSMLLSDKSATGDNQGLKDMQIFSAVKKPTNELEVIQSTRLIRQALERGSFSVVYFEKKNYGKRELYKRSPIKLAFISVEDTTLDYVFTFIKGTDTHYRIEEFGGSSYRLGDTVSIKHENSQVRFCLIKNPSSISSWEFPVQIKFTPLNKLTEDYRKDLDLEVAREKSEILHARIECSSAQRGIDFLNALEYAYMEYDANFRQKIASNTLNVVDQQLRGVISELNGIESNSGNYKSSSNLINANLNSNILLNQQAQQQTQLQEIDNQLSTIAIIEQSIQLGESIAGNLSNSTIGTSDPVLVNSLTHLNDLLAEKNRLSMTTTENNPLNKELISQLDLAKTSVKQNIANAKKSLLAQRLNVTSSGRSLDSVIREVPRKEGRINDLQRAHVVKDNLYTYLLNRREEILISIAAEWPDIRIIDPPFASTRSVWPDKRRIAVFSFLGGILVALMISVFLSLLPKRKNMVPVTANEASVQPNTSMTASREQIDQEEAQEKANTLSPSH